MNYLALLFILGSILIGLGVFSAAICAAVYLMSEN